LLVKPGRADGASGTGLWPVMHRLEACATDGVGEEDAAGVIFLAVSPPP
jgi:hypothetical protein